MTDHNYIVADAILDTLKLHGVSTIFGYPGGAILPFYDVLPKHKEIQHVLVRNEQGAAFAAQGWARSTGKIGVCCSTSGPGATNLITGIADAYLDSIPILCLTGQVPLPTIGNDMFQEVDMTGVTLNITKHNYLLDSPADVVQVLTEAIHIATTGRPGPVHIDMPKDIQAAPHSRHFKIPKLDFSDTDPMMEAYKPLEESTIERVVSLLEMAERPVLLIGQGVKFSGAEEEVRTLVDLLGIPTINTLLGKGIIPHDSEFSLGMLGMHGFYHANLAAHNADLILNIGSRFDDRIVGRYDAFGKKARLIHVDIDRSEFGKVVAVDMPIHCDAKLFVKELLAHPNLKKLQIENWREQIHDWDKKHPYNPKPGSFAIRDCYAALMEEIKKDPKNYIVVADVGQHEMWASLSMDVPEPYQWLCSGGAGTMGFSLPNAIGAAFAHPEKTVICVVGDGGIQMNLQEFGVLMDYKPDIKVCIMNNSYLGMVRQWQELFYDHNYSGVEITSPDFKKVAEGYDLPAMTVESMDGLDSSIASIFSKRGPMIAEFRVEKEENVFPMVPGGKTLGEVIVS